MVRAPLLFAAVNAFLGAATLALASVSQAVFDECEYEGQAWRIMTDSNLEMTKGTASTVMAAGVTAFLVSLFAVEVIRVRAKALVPAMMVMQVFVFAVAVGSFALMIGHVNHVRNFNTNNGAPPENPEFGDCRWASHMYVSPVLPAYAAFAFLSAASALGVLGYFVVEHRRDKRTESTLPLSQSF